METGANSSIRACQNCWLGDANQNAEAKLSVRRAMENAASHKTVQDEALNWFGLEREQKIRNLYVCANHCTTLNAMGSVPRTGQMTFVAMYQPSREEMYSMNLLRHWLLQLDGFLPGGVQRLELESVPLHNFDKISSVRRVDRWERRLANTLRWHLDRIKEINELTIFAPRSFVSS